ncbi:hypothetical protein ACFX16_028170 [Malus domestica]
MAMDGSNMEELAIRGFVSIKTMLSDEFQGQVITFDCPSNIIVIQESSKNRSCHTWVRQKTRSISKSVILISIVSGPGRNW